MFVTDNTARMSIDEIKGVEKLEKELKILQGAMKAFPQYASSYCKPIQVPGTLDVWSIGSTEDDVTIMVFWNSKNNKCTVKKISW